MSSIKFSHTNLVTPNWKRLSRFYIDVFGCVPSGPIRQLSGCSVADGTGVAEPQIEGLHLRLPGFGDQGPTLEIFQYKRNVRQPLKQANTRGITHLAFEVADLDSVCADIIRYGGKMLGRLAKLPVDGVGVCTFVYVRDPDMNIIEIQSWEEG